MEKEDPQTIRHPNFTFPNGDIEIIALYKNNLVYELVNVDSLEKVSLALAKFTYPPFLNGENEIKKLKPPTEQLTRNKAKSLDFTEDDGDSLLIILQLVHNQYNKVPRIIEFDVLLEIAKLSGMLFCQELVSPWFQQWFKDEESEWKFAVGRRDLNYLWICWVFKRNLRLFEYLAKERLMKLYSNHRGDAFLDEELRPIPLGLFPSGLAENMLHIRKETMNKFGKLMTKYQETYADAKCTLGDRQCTLHIRKQLEFKLDGAHYQEHPPREWKERYIERTWWDFRILPYSPLGASDQDPYAGRHSECTLFRKKLTCEKEKVYHSISSPVLAEHRQHSQEGVGSHGRKDCLIVQFTSMNTIRNLQG